MSENGTYQWSPNTNKWKEASPKKLGKFIVLGILAVVLVVAGMTCFYTVDDKQQAVVTTFGEVTDIADPGLHFKLPFGIQKVYPVDVNVYQKIELGYTTDGSGSTVSRTDESTMITGDYNIVNIDFFVEYKITDPQKYLFSSNEPELILKNLIQSQVRNVVGSSKVDDVLTDGKENIQMQVRELVTQILQEYDIGLSLVDVRIQDAEPPTAEVIEAFKNVETAKQTGKAVENEADAYENAQIPAAEAKVDKITQEAEYQKQKRINEATEQVAMFNRMYEEYKKNPDITKSRMYYEAISQVLPGVKVIINTADGEQIDMVLPLEPVVETTVTENGG